jgi:hypothetical protein
MSVFLYLKFGDCIKPVESRRFALKKKATQATNLTADLMSVFLYPSFDVRNKQAECCWSAQMKTSAVLGAKHHLKLPERFVFSLTRRIANCDDPDVPSAS